MVMTITSISIPLLLLGTPKLFTGCSAVGNIHHLLGPGPVTWLLTSLLCRWYPTLNFHQSQNVSLKFPRGSRNAINPTKVNGNLSVITEDQLYFRSQYTCFSVALHLTTSDKLSPSSAMGHGNISSLLLHYTCSRSLFMQHETLTGDPEHDGATAIKSSNKDSRNSINHWTWVVTRGCPNPIEITNTCLQSDSQTFKLSHTGLCPSRNIVWHCHPVARGSLSQGCSHVFLNWRVLWIKASSKWLNLGFTLYLTCPKSAFLWIQKNQKKKENHLVWACTVEARAQKLNSALSQCGHAPLCPRWVQWCHNVAVLLH